MNGLSVDPGGARSAAAAAVPCAAISRRVRISDGRGGFPWPVSKKDARLSGADQASPGGRRQKQRDGLPAQHKSKVSDRNPRRPQGPLVLKVPVQKVLINAIVNSRVNT